MQSSARPRFSFFGQGLLLLLPIAILSALGLFSVRQDKQLLEKEARDRAQEIAGYIAEGLWIACLEPLQRVHHELSDPNQLVDRGILAFQWNKDLVWPPPLELPQPHLGIPASLERAKQLQRIDPDTAGKDYERIIATQPGFTAAAQFGLAQCDALEGRTETAAKRLLPLLRQAAKLESGLPVGAPASLFFLEIGQTNRSLLQQAGLLSEICSNAVQAPTYLSPEILGAAEKLEHAEAAPWKRLWLYHQKARELHRAVKASSSRGDNPMFWFSAPERWLAFRVDHGTQRWVRCVAEREVTQQVVSWLNQQRSLPPYFATSITIAGQSVVTNHLSAPHFSGSAVPVKAPQELAAAQKKLAGSTAVDVRVFLSEPAAFFAQHRWRSLWTSGLVGAAGLTAVLGFAAMCRTIRRQERLQQQKSNFVSSVSHELRAPLASIRLLAEGLERGRVREPGKQNEYVRFIGQECRRLSTLVENVLDFSRIDQGRKQYEFEPTDVAALVKDSCGRMQPRASDLQVNLEFQMTGTPGEAELDGRAIQQALMNLIDNALKHSSAQQTVTVSLEFVDSKFLISVEDHGQGIPPEEQTRIFERFYRRGSELRRETHGIGIGLSLVKHAVDAHGGKIHLQSAVQAGSRFTLELPLQRPAQGKSSQQL